MSNGYILQQGKSEHQQVTFIFSGELTEAQVTQWNLAIRELKRAFGANIMSCTVIGEASPDFNESGWEKWRRRR